MFLNLLVAATRRGTADALTESFALFQNFQLSWRCEFIRGYDMLLEDVLYIECSFVVCLGCPGSPNHVLGVSKSVSSGPCLCIIYF